MSQEFKMSKKEYFIKIFKTIIMVGSGIIVSLLNQLYLYPLFPYHNTQLRYIDHVIAGIGEPIIIFCIFNIVKNAFNLRLSNIFFILCSGALYTLLGLNWELSQYFERGFFQMDQYVCDLLGIFIFFFVFLDFKRKKLTVRNII
ncbi:MAG: hypothetical protein BWY74_00066 [Firmicutes bacterium ADurb.Bin419]|nr:MAG: hypothetical protein BWY74_00066 [Firmicutes bacterium ADurb.Bin419]